MEKLFRACAYEAKSLSGNISMNDELSGNHIKR